MKFQNITKIFVLIVAVLGALFLFLMNSGIDKVMKEADVKETKDLVNKPFENPDLFEAAISEVSLLSGLLIFVGIVIIVSTLLSIVNSLKSGGSIKNVLIGVGLFLAIIIIGFLLSGGENPTVNGNPLYKYSGKVATSNEIQMSGAGLVSFYILITVALGSILFFGIKKSLSKS